MPESESKRKIPGQRKPPEKKLESKLKFKPASKPASAPEKRRAASVATVPIPPRIKAVRALMSEQQCTHALVTDPVDVEYISGFRSSNATLLISAARLELFTDFRYKEAAQEFCQSNDRWKFTLIEESGFKFLKKKFRSGAAVGIQSDAVTIDRCQDLERVLPPSAEIVALSSDISDIAIQKFEKEIASMKAAANIADKALEALMPLIKKPVTELELARLLEGLCAENGSEKPAFDTIVLFGERSALPHGQPGDRELAAGDFVLIDFGCTVNGFRSDMTRTFVYGKASDEQRRIYNAVLRAQRCACMAARAGMTCVELDSTARSAIDESGYGNFFGHATGHGIGLRVHERPRVNKDVDTVLLENSVVTIEPGIYLPDTGGVRIEDMAVLQRNGAEIITQSPRKLLELPI
ncbi:MAG: aminopeptidase P family protein [Chitinispirillales bacterium]|nr:aminopeptidase P family protein [Chitinispirillales bacterium]